MENVLYLSGNGTVIIEVLSCAFYIWKQKLRLSNRCTVVCILGFLAAMLGLQHVYIDIGGISPIILMMINIMVLKFLPMFLMVTILVSGNFCISVFVFSEAFTTSELFGALTLIISQLVRRGQKITVYWGELMLIVTGILICFLILFLVFFYHSGKKDRVFQVTIDRKMALLALVISYISFAVSFTFGWSGQEQDYIGIQWYFSITIYCCGLLMLFMLRKSLMEIQLKKEIQSVQGMLNLRYQQYKDYVDNTSYLERQLHDLKHQIAGMRLAGNDNWKDYLDELENAVRTYETWNVSGNSVLDSLLTQIRQFGMKYGIQLTCKADGKALDFLPVRSLCSIFGNLLDNAAEAVIMLENPDERIIQLEVTQKEHFLLIRMENRCETPLCFEEGSLPPTTKKNKQNHGIGLKSVKMTVEQYGGSMNLTRENGWFVVSILIPV